MKVIFLDIDGVLNDSTHIAKCFKLLGQDLFYKICALNNSNPPFNYHSVENIKKLIQDSHSGVVLSSTWRINKKNIQVVEAELGIQVYDITTPFITSGIRGKEIQTYLDAHPEITNYVIIDDDRDMLPSQFEHFCHVNRTKGFTRQKYKFCMEVLNDK